MSRLIDKKHLSISSDGLLNLTLPEHQICYVRVCRLSKALIRRVDASYFTQRPFMLVMATAFLGYEHSPIWYKLNNSYRISSNNNLLLHGTKQKT